MPTILLILGCRVVVYPNDHRTAHVRVIGGDAEAVFNLHCPHGPPELGENYGISRVEVRRFRAALTEALGRMCAAWSEKHGAY